MMLMVACEYVVVVRGDNKKKPKTLSDELITMSEEPKSPYFHNNYPDRQAMQRDVTATLDIGQRQKKNLRKCV